MLARKKIKPALFTENIIIYVEKHKDTTPKKKKKRKTKTPGTNQ